jgi:transposase
MLDAGLDLSRKKVDVCLLSGDGEIVDEWASPPDADGLRGLAARAAMWALPVRGVIESMNGARFVHDRLEEHGWDVLIADATKVKGLAPLACKTDKIDARVLATLSARDLVPEIWLPDPSVRRERELARFRLHLVRHRTTLKNRIHASLIAFGHPCPVSDLFGYAGRELLDRLEIPDPWRSNIDVSLELIDDLDLQIAALTVQLKRQGADTATSRCWSPRRGSGGSTPTRSLRRSATSPALRRRQSCAATRDCARESSSRAPPTPADHCPSTGPSTCGGRCSRRRLTLASIPITPSATSTPSAGSAANAAPRSPRSTSPAGSPRPSGTCSPAISPSLRQVPLFV